MPFRAIWLLLLKGRHRIKMIIGRSDLSKDFDQIAVVVDWLDACRARDLEALLDLYAQDASLECACNDRKVFQGRADLASYWRPRLGDFSPTAFGLDEITPSADGVVLDYVSFEGKPVRIYFAFDNDGKVLQTRCEPSARP
jgi:ketosteroid isomerase-like protein